MQYKNKKCPVTLPKSRYILEEPLWRPSRIIRALLWRWFSTACPKDTFILKWHYGIKLIAYPKDEIGYEIFRTGKFEPNEFYFLDKALKEGMTFIDVGANMGLFSLFASKKTGNCGTVIAIEPSNRDFYRLKVNTELNKLNNIRLIKAAASDSKRMAELLVAGEEHAGHNTLGDFSHDCSTFKEKQIVETCTLDGLVETEKLHKVDFIKIDTEGHELFVLKGAVNTLRKFHPVLLIELADISLIQQGCNSGQIWEFLTALNYKIYLYDNLTGMLVLGERKNSFYENIVAIHETQSLNTLFHTDKL